VCVIIQLIQTTISILPRIAPNLPTLLRSVAEIAKLAPETFQPEADFFVNHVMKTLLLTDIETAIASPSKSKKRKKRRRGKLLQADVQDSKMSSQSDSKIDPNDTLIQAKVFFCFLCRCSFMMRSFRFRFINTFLCIIIINFC